MHHKNFKRISGLSLAIVGALYASWGHAAEDAIIANEDRLNMETADGLFTYQVFGRIQADVASYAEDVASLGSGTELRRTRIGLAGTFLEDWAYKAEYDFGSEEVSLADSYLEYLGFDPLVIAAGHFKQPFSLENITSSNDITFMERALIYESLTPGRRIGAGVGYGVDNWHVAMGIFGETASGDAGEDDDGSEFDSGFSTTARVTYAPLLSDIRLVHLGASVYWRDPSQGEETRFLTRPEPHITDVRLVDTGVLSGVDDVQTYGLEAATVWGPFHTEGEYLLFNVNASVGDSDFDGWYVQGGYFLTGESRPCSAEEGKWERVKPRGPMARGRWRCVTAPSI